MVDPAAHTDVDLRARDLPGMDATTRKPLFVFLLFGLLLLRYAQRTFSA